MRKQNRPLFFVLVMLLILSCEPSATESIKSYDFLFYKYVGEAVTSYERTTLFSQKIEGKKHYLQYIYSDKYSNSGDTINFMFHLDSNDSRYWSSNSQNNSEQFIFLSKRSFNANKRNWVVYKYALNPTSTDGCAVYFWNPELGIILFRSTTWYSFNKLKTTNNVELDIVLSTLLDVLFQDSEFYKGCS